MSENTQLHREHLQIVLERLSNAGLSINVNKCNFGASEINFLGYTLNKDGSKPLSERVTAILEYKKPETIRELRRFLGILNYYRRCIPHAAQLQAPLNNFLQGARKNDKIPWTPTTDAVFENCKKSLAETTLISHPATDSKLALITDASDLAIGAVVEQLEDNIWKPLGFFSRKLTPTQRNYSTYDRELLAIYEAIKFFQHLLEGRKFIIKTDHKPLVYAFSQKPEKASPKQLRHLDYISQFSTQILHVTGSDNEVADAFSRLYQIDMPFSVEPQEFQEAQQSDTELSNLIAGNTSLKIQKLNIGSNSIYCDTSTEHIRPLVPKSLRSKVFMSVHGLSHPSGKATLRQTKIRMAKYEKRYITMVAYMYPVPTIQSLATQSTRAEQDRCTSSTIPSRALRSHRPSTTPRISILSHNDRSVHSLAGSHST